MEKGRAVAEQDQTKKVSEVATRYRYNRTEIHEDRDVAPWQALNTVVLSGND